jgi:VWFA-related protein
MRTNKPSFAAAALLALLGTAAIAQQPPPAPPAEEETPTATFPSEIEQVIVDLVVVDKKDKPVTDLRQDELVITEDGKPQTITSFERVSLTPAPVEVKVDRPRVSTNQRPENRTGRSFVVLFDDVHLTPFQAHRAKQAVASFLERGTAEGDLVTLVAAGGGVWWTTRMPQGREELVGMLKRLDGRFIPDTSPERMSDHEAMMIHVFRDQRTIERVNRRYDTFGVNPSGRQSSMGNSSQQSFGADADPMVTGRAAEVYYSATSRNRITLDVMKRMLDSVGSARGRKSLVLVSAGFIYDPNLQEFKDVVQSARRSNVAVYFLDTRGLGGISIYTTAEFGPALDTQDLGAAFTEHLEEAEGAESIAADSGGFVVRNTNDLTKGIERIATESQNYYLAGYVSSNTNRDGKFRKISVKVARKGTDVRARKGYYAPGGEKKKEKKGGPDPALQAALDSPYEEDGIPMRMASYVLDETILGKAATLLVTDIDVRGLPFEEKEGRLVNSLEYLVVAAHRETGEFFQYNQTVSMRLQPATKERLDKTWYPVVKDFELPPGFYQAKIVVRELNSKRLGTVVHEFEVQDPTKFRTSTPVVSDTLTPTQEAKEKPRPAILARRNFPTGSTVFCSLDVYGAAKDKESGMPRVSMGYSVLKKDDGSVVNRIDPTVIAPTSLGKLSRMIGFGMDTAAPGEYQLVINIRDELSGQTLELREPFTLERPGPAVADKPATP